VSILYNGKKKKMQKEILTKILIKVNVNKAKRKAINWKPKTKKLKLQFLYQNGKMHMKDCYMSIVYIRYIYLYKSYIEYIFRITAVNWH